MREKKSFFTKNNSLNKGSRLERNKKLSHSERNLVELYYSASPSVKKELEAAILNHQQVHNSNLLSNVVVGSLSRMSTLIFIFLLTAICYFSYDLMSRHQMTEAIILAIISFTALLLIISKLKDHSKISNDAKIISESKFKKKTKGYKYHKTK